MVAAMRTNRILTHYSVVLWVPGMIVNKFSLVCL
eukprot:SAG11_NODE_6745_length_1255_cov_1.565744_1_plen_33_part_10